ncbi:hypothetical protein QTI24_19205 [Variovorax sp. J22P240]|uniref:hypothetical protein n=1 Tax=unclassified Variovorax TaxID=663243 RepID=UPI0025758C6B|nr:MULTISPECIES: hypothetical protein [unclassified Variovorax]MDM0000750.1 hypothetical protein [Variovorax sp. J22P240]MDM0047526.1 hypothetical protein [Variovorax sp. J22R115]
MPAPIHWQPMPHPTIPSAFCLERYPHADRIERLSNRLSTSPAVEAFASRKQAVDTAEFLNARRRSFHPTEEIHELDFADC